MRLAIVAALWLVHPLHGSDQIVSDLGDNGGANQLRSKITACLNSGGGSITFSVAGVITLTAGALPTIANPNPDGTISLTIDGGGKITLSGLGTNSTQSRILTIDTSAAVTVKNVILTKANYGFDDGGAISNRGSLIVDHCQFIDNRTTPNFSGGAIVSYGPLTISDTEFAANKGGGGGAVYPRFGSATTMITRCNFHDNEAINTSGGGLGGALLIWDGPTVTVDRSTFSNNKAVKNGGAVYILPNSSLTATQTLFSGNSVTGGFNTEGGGIDNFGTVNLTDCTVSGNTMPNGGAGCGIGNNGTATLMNVTLSGNFIDHGGHGGGINQNSGTCNLTNVTVSGNMVPDNYPQWGGQGGGIYTSGGSLTLTNVTLSGNRTGHSPGSGGGGIVVGNTTAATIKNTVIAHGADGENCVGVSGGTANLSDDNSCGFGAGRDGVANLNLGPLAYNGGLTQTHLPQAGSAAIDNGTATGAPLLDQRGYFRTGTPIDAGAVEANGVGLRILNVMRYNNDAAITFQGVAGFKFRLEREGDVTASDWQPLLDVIPSSTGPVQISDVGAFNLGEAFYRVRWLP